tara:strand:- start:150 stop:803 length:654 start_codon:yes stop_codon:yes gene_type:complete
MRNNLKLLGGKTLQSPKGLYTRPTTSRVREALMNILQGEIQNCQWLDLFSGSGVVGCEALQRGARRVCSVESHKNTAHICHSNLISTASGIFQQNYIEVFCSEVNKFLREGCLKHSFKFTSVFPNSDPRFDFVYIDPPYQSNLYSSALDNLLHGGWIKSNSLVICEYSKKFSADISSSWKVFDEKNYGNSNIVLITPNQASHYLYDIGSKPQQIVPK